MLLDTRAAPSSGRHQGPCGWQERHQSNLQLYNGAHSITVLDPQAGLLHDTLVIPLEYVHAIHFRELSLTVVQASLVSLPHCTTTSFHTCMWFFRDFLLALKHLSV